MLVSHKARKTMFGTKSRQEAPPLTTSLTNTSDYNYHRQCTHLVVYHQ